MNIGSSEIIVQKHSNIHKHSLEESEIVNNQVIPIKSTAAHTVYTMQFDSLHLKPVYRRQCNISQQLPQTTPSLHFSKLLQTFHSSTKLKLHPVNKFTTKKLNSPLFGQVVSFVPRFPLIRAPIRLIQVTFPRVLKFCFSSNY